MDDAQDSRLAENSSCVLNHSSLEVSAPLVLTMFCFLALPHLNARVLASLECLQEVTISLIPSLFCLLILPT